MCVNDADESGGGSLDENLGCVKLIIHMSRWKISDGGSSSQVSRRRSEVASSRSSSPSHIQPSAGTGWKMAGKWPQMSRLVSLSGRHAAQPSSFT